MSLLQVGPMQFQVTGPHFERLKHGHQFVWPKHDRFGQPPAYQFTGAGPETVDIDGTVYPEYFRGFEELQNLAGRGSQPQTVVSGAGDVFGRWIVLKLQLRQSYFNRDGAPRKVDFRISLEKFQGNRGSGGGLF